jgi:diketogulonate reductase-like aldo/keto reductase
LDLGMSLIDTAEMYGDGGAEEVIAEAIAGRRTEVFLASKVYPHNATRRGVIEACGRSLRRLKTDYLDLYLLHWRGSIPLAETFAGFHTLKHAGKILDFGVSNFDQTSMGEANFLYGSDEIATDQVMYNLRRRGVEWDLLPWCREHGMPIMAYSPIDQGRLANHRGLGRIASRHNAKPVQVALAWLLQQKGVVVIPKAAEVGHVLENGAALELKLTNEDLAELDRAFPKPRRKVQFEMT